MKHDDLCDYAQPCTNAFGLGVTYKRHKMPPVRYVHADGHIELGYWCVACGAQCNCQTVSRMRNALT